MLINGESFIEKSYNVRIKIGDLVEACRVLGETRVVAAGSIYATLYCDFHDRRRLSKAGIDWTID